MNIRKLAWRNIISNPFNTTLSVLLMTFGVAIISLLLLLNNQIEKQLQNNLRGIDMVIGAKGSPLQLILSSVYHIDNPTGNISFKEADKLTKNPMVDLTIPLSYGDSYNGFRIVGTTSQYPELYEAELKEGHLWNQSMEVVVGSMVSQIANLNIGDKFFGTHGFGESGHVHDNHYYKVVGILKESNSVIDKLIITDIKSVWEVHNPTTETDESHSCEHHDHNSHQEHKCSDEIHNPTTETDESHSCEHHDHNSHQEHKCSDEIHKDDLYMSDGFMITSMLVGFKNPVGFIQLPRKVNETTNLQAAMPVFEINRLTNLLGFGVQTINLIALIIILVSGLSIFISLYNSLKKRRYELALIRVHGATKWQLIKLVLLEGLALSFMGTIFGLLISRLILFLTPILANQNQVLNSFEFGVIADELWLFLIALFIGLLASLIPAILTYKINIPKILSNA
jgi:putative ABC transport system permease protein